MSIPVENQEGKAILVALFLKERETLYKFFQPFQTAFNYKLVRFLLSTHVPKARIENFFVIAFLGNTWTQKSRFL